MRISKKNARELWEPYKSGERKLAWQGQAEQGTKGHTNPNTLLSIAGFLIVLLLLALNSGFTPYGLIFLSVIIATVAAPVLAIRFLLRLSFGNKSDAPSQFGISETHAFFIKGANVRAIELSDVKYVDRRTSGTFEELMIHKNGGNSSWRINIMGRRYNAEAIEDRFCNLKNAEAPTQTFLSLGVKVKHYGLDLQTKEMDFGKQLGRGF